MVEFFKEKKDRTDKHNSSLVLLFHFPNPSQLALFDLAGRDKRTLENVVPETTVYLSQNQFLKKLYLSAKLPVEVNTSLSLAIVPHQLLALNTGMVMYTTSPQPWEPKVYFEHLPPIQIIFSVRGDGAVTFGNFLENGVLLINPYYKDFITHLIKSSPHSDLPVKAIMTELMPTETRDYADNQLACRNFILKLGQFDKQLQWGLLEELSLELNSSAKTTISAVTQRRQDRENGWEIDYQLKSASARKLPEDTRKTIIEYLGPNIPGYSKDLNEAPSTDEIETESAHP